ncbi:MAG: ComEC/Rec2 family competence protein [Treponema sp.]|jgi:competence protein ComEC|nr:ComEC/Rec2 family competence protein [Treponema sp.]
MGSINRLRLTPVLCAALGAAAGFYILFRAPFAVIVSVLILFLVTICFFRVLASLDSSVKTRCLLSAKPRTLQLTSVCAAAFTIGLFLGLSAADAGRSDVYFGINENNITGVEGILLDDPRVLQSGSAMAAISLHRCTGNKGMRASASGEITVFFPQVSAEKIKQFGRGTTVFAEGALRSSLYGWSFSAQSLHILKPAPSIERMRTDIRLSLSKLFEDEKWGGLALALLLGIRDNLDSNFTAQYRDAGLSYILALSGMHLAILTALIAFLLKRPLGLKASAITSAALIILYCLLVGPMPSLNRSALMYILGVIAILGALPKNSMSILSLSFLIQIIITPAAGNTLSFILSYLALLGILITGQAFSFLFAGKVPDFLLQPLSLSAGAFLATAGICSFTFGIISPAGIIAGLLIVPLTTIFMIGSIIWLFLSIFSLSFPLSFPLSLLYNLMESTASVTGNLPGVSANPYLVLGLSLALSVLMVVLEYRRRKAMFKLQPFT